MTANRPGALGVDQFIPGADALSAELTANRPGALGVDQFIPGADALSAELTANRPGAFGVDQFIPGADALQSLLTSFQPDPFNPNQLMPGSDALQEFLDLNLPDRLTPDQLLPSAIDLQEAFDLRQPLYSPPPPPAGKAAPGDGGDGGDGGGQPPVDTPADPEGLDAMLAELQGIVRNLTTTPQTTEELRLDPLTASLLEDFADLGEGDRSQAMEDLQRLGVLGSGDTVDVLGELTAGQRRGEFDILGDAASRFDKDRISGLSTGVDLFGRATQRDLGMSELELKRSQQDQELLAAITASLDPALNLGTKDVRQRELARILLSLTGIPDSTKVRLLNLINTGSDWQDDPENFPTDEDGNPVEITL